VSFKCVGISFEIIGDMNGREIIMPQIKIIPRSLVLFVLDFSLSDGFLQEDFPFISKQSFNQKGRM